LAHSKLEIQQQQRTYVSGIDEDIPWQQGGNTEEQEDKVDDIALVLDWGCFALEELHFVQLNNFIAFLWRI